MSNSPAIQGRLGSLIVTAFFFIAGIVTLYDTTSYSDTDSQVFPQTVAIGATQDLRRAATVAGPSGLFHIERQRGLLHVERQGEALASGIADTSHTLDRNRLRRVSFEFHNSERWPCQSLCDARLPS